MLTLTQQNYHSIEADQQYMSNSLYKDFLQCEAQAMAKLNGDWIEPPSEAMLVGSYLHAWAEGVLDEFTEEHPEMFTKGGGLKAGFKQADKMIETLQNDPFCMFALQGEKEVIITADFAGATWKAKLDVYNPESGRFADIKTTRAIDTRIWLDGVGYCRFIEAYGYLKQMALYAELERIQSGRNEWLEPLIVAVSKENVPDKAIINFDNDRIAMELEEIESHMPRILDVKHGREEPKACGHCDYCKSTKKLSRIMHYTELI